MADIPALIRALAQSRGVLGARRLERATDEVPAIEQQFTDGALSHLFNHAGAAITPFDPSRFEELAIGLPEHRAKQTLKNVTKVEKYLDQGGFSSVPHLSIIPRDPSDLSVARIAGHEGRHRNRGLVNQGQDKTILGLFPYFGYGPLKGENVLYDESINSLLENLRQVRSVVPERGFRRDDPEPLDFSDYFKPFAKGGLAQMKDHHAD